MPETYLSMMDEGYYEADCAFRGLADANVWKRPAPGLLSVGELAGHMAYWEAVRLTRESEEPIDIAIEGERLPDLTRLHVNSPLIDHRFRYHPETLTSAPSKEHFQMTAEMVGSELQRVHRESSAYFQEQRHDIDIPLVGWPGNPTYRAILSYLCFHIGYHVGQIYTVRHLLGENTEDN